MSDDPDDDVTVEEHMRRKREAQGAETQKTCPWCRGNGMAPASKVEHWCATYPELAEKESILP